MHHADFTKSSTPYVSSNTPDINIMHASKRKKIHSTRTRHKEADDLSLKTNDVVGGKVKLGIEQKNRNSESTSLSTGDSDNMSVTDSSSSERRGRGLKRRASEKFNAIRRSITPSPSRSSSRELIPELNLSSETSLPSSANATTLQRYMDNRTQGLILILDKKGALQIVDMADGKFKASNVINGILEALNLIETLSNDAQKTKLLDRIIDRCGQYVNTHTENIINEKKIEILLKPLKDVLVSSQKMENQIDNIILMLKVLSKPIEGFRGNHVKRALIKKIAGGEKGVEEIIAKLNKERESVNENIKQVRDAVEFNSQDLEKLEAIVNGLDLNKSRYNVNTTENLTTPFLETLKKLIKDKLEKLKENEKDENAIKQLDKKYLKLKEQINFIDTCVNLGAIETHIDILEPEKFTEIALNINKFLNKK